MPLFGTGRGARSDRRHLRQDSFPGSFVLKVVRISSRGFRLSRCDSGRRCIEYHATLHHASQDTTFSKTRSI